jgi:hypothetical protein
MNLEIINFTKNNKIYKKYICENHEGLSNSPHVKWNKIDGAKSYALIMEDPDIPSGGIFIHWYIPFIDPTIQELDEINGSLYNKYNKIKNKNKKSFLKNMKIIQGKNTIKKYGYHGPCAPDGSGKHRYIFRLYAFNIKIRIDESLLNIISSNDFILKLKKKYSSLKIIAEDEKIFTYSYLDYEKG